MLERVLKQNFFAVSAQAFVLVFGVAFTVAFAHLLSKEEFGLLATFVSLSMLAVNLSDVGVQQTVIRFFGKSFFAKDGKAGFYFWRLLKIKFAAAFVVCTLAVVFSSQLAEVILHDGSLAYVFQLAGASAFVYTFIHYSGFLFSAVNKYEFVSLSSLCLNALKLAVPLAAVYYFGASAANAIAGVSLAFVLSLVVYFAIFLHLFKGRIDAKKQGDTKAVNKFLFYSALTAFINQLFSNSDIMLINYFGDASQVALYRAAQVIMIGVLTLVPVSATFLYSFFVELEVRKREDAQAKMFDRMIKYGAMLLIPLTFYLFFFAEDIMQIYPKGYTESVPALRVFSLALFFIFIQSVSSTLLYTKAMMKKLTAFTLLFSILIIAFNIIAIPTYGFFGAAVSYLTAYIAVSLAMMTVSLKSLKLRFKPMHVIKPILISIGVTLLLVKATAYVDTFALFIATPFIFALVYALLLEVEDKELITRVMNIATRRQK